MAAPVEPCTPGLARAQPGLWAWPAQDESALARRLPVLRASESPGGPVGADRPAATRGRSGLQRAHRVSRPGRGSAASAADRERPRTQAGRQETARAPVG